LRRIFSVAGRTALVTGAGSGLGRAIAEGFAQFGASVAVLDIDRIAAESVARGISDSGSRAFALTCDVSKPDQDVEAVAQAVGRFGGLEILLNHNVETVERLQKPVRKRARYDRSLGVLARASTYAVEVGLSLHTKSSIMVGLGEERAELSRTFRDLRAVDCDILTIGQYLRPTKQHLPLVRYYHPNEFTEMRAEALSLGFKHVESGPLVRSSYHARDQVPGAERMRLRRRQASIDAVGRVVPGTTSHHAVQ
jgi:lipoic acid synthetase